MLLRSAVTSLLLWPALPFLAAAPDHFSLSAEKVSAFEAEIRPLFQSYCYGCHGAEKQSSGLRFDILDAHRLSAIDTDTLHHTRDVLTFEEMPPRDADLQITTTDRQILLDWVTGALTETTIQRRELESQPRLRRLSVREYNNTLRDIFNAPAEFSSLLPPDPISEKGFDTAHDLLMISQIDLRIFMESARIALDKYMHLGEASGQKEYFLAEIEDIYHHCRFRGETRAKQLAPAAVSEAEFLKMRADRTGAPVIYRDRNYGPLPFGHIPEGNTPGVDEGNGFARLHSQYLLVKTKQRAGEVVVRVHAAATRGADGTYPRMRLESGRRAFQNMKVINAGEYDVTAPKADPGTYTFRFRIENALQVVPGSEDDKDLEHLFFAISNVARNENGILAASIDGQEDLSLYRSGEGIPGALVSQARSATRQTEAALAAWEAAQTNYLHLDAIEVEILPARNDPHNPWILTAPDTPESEPIIAREALDSLLPKIFRRPVTENEFKRYYDVYEQQRMDGLDFKSALSDAFVAAMASPSFLYIGKPAEDLEHAESLAYASKLAYFLWASPPDERLVAIAASGRLKDRAVLAAEIDRMLDDPKSKRFSATFVEQWLDLRKLGEVTFDYELYPEYGPELAALTKRQTIETFQAVFHAGGDARQLYRSDSTLLNNLLARHYGLPPVEGGDLRMVPTPQTRQAGGILTHASILAINSDGKQSHPIKRGTWLLEKILYEPPPPPPPAVPDLDPTSIDTRHLSLKDRIELHREQHGCVSCHERIDPWGIAFEEFDATGRWRDAGSLPYPIDSTTRLPDGTELAGAAELAGYMLDVKEGEMMRAIAKGMMTYATGAELDILDDQEVDRLLAAFRESGYNLKHLAGTIAQTRKFDEFINESQPTAHYTVTHEQPTAHAH